MLGELTVEFVKPAVKHGLSPHSHSTFNVGRSMLDVHFFYSFPNQNNLVHMASVNGHLVGDPDIIAGVNGTAGARGCPGTDIHRKVGTG